MRNRFVCLLLVLIMALPLVLASCTSETELKDVPAPVYTLYCITGDTTTAQAITEIEYDLNRTLFYRIGSIVKLVLVTKDEYHDLIQAKMDEVSDYINGTNISGTNESNEKNSLVNTAKLSENAEKAGYKAMSGEAILNDLEAGIEIELECPRLDLFLVTDYNSYLELAENGDLVALDTVLGNEAKAIKSYVHSSFFNAAKIGKKTYGVPCNTVIGEYTYLVFNEEVLRESGVAQETLLSLDDLSDYLDLVKTTRPDVVPLANAVTPTEFSFMFNDGFPVFVNQSGYVQSTYENNDQATAYFTMLTRYKALGYFENEDGKTGEDSDVPFAAKFVTGTKAQIEELAKKNGYAYNQYSVPVATSENCIDCIYCLSSLCPNSWQTDAMEILTELYTDVNLQNTFLYGIENNNYRLEGGQVARLNDSYMMDYAHTGNCFIAYTDKDAHDSLQKWDDARKQNIDAVESKTIGYTFEPKKFVFSKEKDENGQDVEWALCEPNYEEILWNIVQPYYNAIIDGTAVEFDYQHEQELARKNALQSIYDELLENYTMRLQTQYTASLKDQITEQYGESFRAQALQSVQEELVDYFNGGKARRKKLAAKLKEENEDASDDEIDAMVDQLLNDKETLWENYRTLVRKETQWQEALESAYQVQLEEKIEAETERVLSSAAYQKELKDIPNTEKFQNEYNTTIELEVEDSVRKNVDSALSALIKEYCDEMIQVCEEKLKEEIYAFAALYAEAKWKLYKDGVYAQMKTLFPQASESELIEHQHEWMTLIQDSAELNKDKLGANLESMLKKQYGEMDSDTATEKMEEALKLYSDVLLPLYQDAYNKETLALCDIGYASRSSLKTFSVSSSTDETPSEPEEPQEPTTPGVDEPVAGSFSSFYEFVISVKFRTPYYDQFGTPN